MDRSEYEELKPIVPGKQIPLTVGPAWAQLTGYLMDTTWEDLKRKRAEESFEYIKLTREERDAISVREIVMLEAMLGDQGQMTIFLGQMIDRIVKAETLTSAEAYVMAMILARLYRSPKGVQFACGVDKKRGGAKQGSKSLSTALAVIRELSHGSASSYEEAWAVVAESRHISESMVKKYWTSRKALAMRLSNRPSDMTAAEIIAEGVAAGFRSAP